MLISFTLIINFYIKITEIWNMHIKFYHKVNYYNKIFQGSSILNDVKILNRKKFLIQDKV